MHQSEGADHAALSPGRLRAGGRHEVGNHGERLVLGSAVGLDERPRRGAKPRAPDRVGQQREQRLFELALGLDLGRRFDVVRSRA